LTSTVVRAQFAVVSGCTKVEVGIVLAAVENEPEVGASVAVAMAIAVVGCGWCCIIAPPLHTGMPRAKMKSGVRDRGQGTADRRTTYRKEGRNEERRKEGSPIERLV
jgi:hypothetical protein